MCYKTNDLDYCANMTEFFAFATPPDGKSDMMKDQRANDDSHAMHRKAAGMNPGNDTRRYEVKKYPNRRFYDVTRSRHVTLSDLHELVRDGNEIHVIDSATGSDITNVVLAQIILEHDPPKLDLFPASLLHQAIQANEQMVRKFIEQYFAQAMDAFVRSRKQFDDYLRQVGFSALTPMAPFDWVRMLFPQGGGLPFGPRSASRVDSASGDGHTARGEQMPPDTEEPIEKPHTTSTTPGGRRAGETSDTLERQIAALREELASLQSKVGIPKGRTTKPAKVRKTRK